MSPPLTFLFPISGGIFGTSSTSSEPPVFTFDLLFGFPFSTRPLVDGVHWQCMDHHQQDEGKCFPSLLGIAAAVVSPVASVYVAVLVVICHRIHVAVVAAWMGAGACAASLYGALASAGFDAVLAAVASRDWSAAALVVVVCGACGAAALLALLCVVQRLGVARCVALRHLGAVAAACAVRSWALRVRSPDLLLSDVAGIALVVVGASVVVVEALFF